MPRLEDTFHNIFDERGCFVGFANELPEVIVTKELLVKNLQVKEAVAYRTEKQGDYRRLLKQPKIHFSYNKEDLFIIDRRVCWDLIRNFDPEIDYRTFLEMLEYFSLYKILEDYLHDYSDTTLTCYIMECVGGNKIITAISHTATVQNLLHDEIIKYVKSKTEIDGHESFFRVGRSINAQPGISPTMLKRFNCVYLRIIKGDTFLEIKEQIGDRRSTGQTTQIRLFKEDGEALVQMLPRKTFHRNLETIDSEILYANLDEIIKTMETKFIRKANASDYRGRGGMSDREWDIMQHTWFCNYFSKVDG